MSKLWKVISVIAIVLIVLGVAAGAIGFFTGGSVDRMIEVFFGSKETFNMVLQLLKSQLASIFASI